MEHINQKLIALLLPPEKILLIIYIDSFDYFTLYTLLPHIVIKENISYLIK